MTGKLKKLYRENLNRDMNQARGNQRNLGNLLCGFCRPAKIIPDCRMQPQRYLHLDFSALFTIRVMQTVYAVLAIELVFFNPALGEPPQGRRGGPREKERNEKLVLKKKKKKLYSLKQTRLVSYASTRGPSITSTQGIPGDQPKFYGRDAKIVRQFVRRSSLPAGRCFTCSAGMKYEPVVT